MVDCENAHQPNNLSLFIYDCVIITEVGKNISKGKTCIVRSSPCWTSNLEQYHLFNMAYQKKKSKKRYVI